MTYDEFIEVYNYSPEYDTKYFDLAVGAIAYHWYSDEGGYCYEKWLQDNHHKDYDGYIRQWLADNDARIYIKYTASELDSVYFNLVEPLMNYIYMLENKEN